MLPRLPVVVLTTLVAFTLQAPQHAGAHAMRNHRYKWVATADHHVYVRMGVQTCSEDNYYIRVHNDRNGPVELDWLLHTLSNPSFDSEGGAVEIPA
jgi:hypothetical protein